MADLSDEICMAYVDNELSPSERAEVDAALAHNPSLRKRMEAFEKTRELGHGLGPVPQHLIDLVMTAPMGPVRRRAKGRAGFLETLTRSFAFPIPVWSGAMIGAAAMLAGVLVAPALRTGTSGGAPPLAMPGTGLLSLNAGHLAAQGPLRDLLETALSVTEPGSAGAGNDLRIRLSFVNQQAQFCRQYEVGLPDTGRLVGIGCRTGDGRWEVVATTTAAAEPGSDATSAAEGSGSDPVAAYVLRKKHGDVMSAEQEKAALAAKWRR